MRARFRFRTIPFIATLALAILGILLGNWQVRRAQEKTALQTSFSERGAAPPLVLGAGPLDPAAAEFRRATVSGEFVANWPVYLDNRPLDGRSGVILLMPFTIAGSKRVILVERGWLPHDPGVHERVLPVPTPAGRQTISGILVRHPPRVLQLGTPGPLAPGAIVQNLDPAGFARASGLDVLPLLLEQSDADGVAAPLVRKWQGPALDIDRNKGYAFQWYALAALAVVFFVMTGFRSGRKHAS